MAHPLLDTAAELGSESDDGDYDEENAGQNEGKPARNTRGMDDSSEEEDEDDDEEAAAAIREGFIVDEDEEDEEERRARRRERRKRRRAEREEEEAALDEEDLDLIGETVPREQPTQSKFKRLKRGHREERPERGPRGVDDIFSDEDEDLGDGYDERPSRREQRGGVTDEFADFIEEDVFDDEEGLQDEEDREVARPGKRTVAGVGFPEAGLDEAEMEDYRNAFGDGTEYDWALELQEQKDEEELGDEKPLELKDVFEPSQLAEKMMTDEDNTIRFTDVPERFQLARKPFKPLELDEDEMANRLGVEALWVSKLLWPKKRLGQSCEQPFQKAVRKVLELMNIEDLEVPFIFNHRKDYLIHSSSQQDQDDIDGNSGPQRLLTQADLWEIFELDLKFRALSEKREALIKTYDTLRTISNVEDPVFEMLLTKAESIEEIQDIQDYIHFTYSAQLKDVNTMEAEAGTGVQKRTRGGNTVYERIRASKVYNLVRAIGITPDDYAKNLQKEGHRLYPEDPQEMPEDMADHLLEPPEYQTSAAVLRSAKAMFAEELVMSPRMRSIMRRTFYTSGLFDIYRTEKGLRKITEDHPYYEFKYLRNQEYTAMARRPELFLRMLKAEDEGMVEVKVRLQNYDRIKEEFRSLLSSDGTSDRAANWNKFRSEILDMALPKLERIIAKGVKETVKAECENALARQCKDRYAEKLDQAPYKPKGMQLGTIPRVLALSNGNGIPGRDAVCYAWVDEEGRVLEQGKFNDLRPGNKEKYIPDAKDIEDLVELIQRRRPDVIGVSGFSVETRKLYKDLQQIVDDHDLHCADYEDEDGNEKSDKLEVVMVNDEIARLYHTSDRSNVDHPGQPPLVKYCIALARFLQSPLKEYAALGKDIISVSFDPNQILLPQDKLMKYLEMAMVDIVNLVGIEINDAIADSYLANLIPYVCGLGPRKAQQLLKVTNLNGGVVYTRDELVGDPDKKVLPSVGPKVWTNCASFLYISYDPTEPESDYLDSTRVHPEDYDLGRKMAADALEMDEEDIKAEQDENGPGAVVKRLIREDAQEKVNDLVLEEYAEQLEAQFHQRKRATLETIRAELQVPYEELRNKFTYMTSDEIYTMLTGETRESLSEGMIVPVKIRRVFPDHIEGRLDCGMEAICNEPEFPNNVGGERGIDPRQVFQSNQTVQAKVTFLNRKALSCQVSFNEKQLKDGHNRHIDRPRGEWADDQEKADKDAEAKEKESKTGRAQRVIKHPLFRPFNAAQAEEFLGSQGRGDVVIRPSSKGLDHLAVTWKVSDNIYQHIDVLELDKENEFSLGRTLKIGGKYTYSDLDELIVLHVKAMAKKVDEMMTDEKYQSGSRAQTEQWLTTYTEANPRRSMYAFCINPKFPGYFHLCFKAGQQAELASWPVKVIPNAFELQKNHYPDMRALKNGFKLLFANNAARKR
ncbi:putative transcription elongation factor spt6 protein [Lasiodiplodia theobromae]|uniref:Transcription elongation factor Spt6 n=2 Tax=Lasiodiplodia TaxID=66739 RepID=A0A5N5DPI0_9PEZI|nr:Transcription elongation factor spt6 [Lasiodiplodia theobromae]KAB2578802.1 Transcription elongation factor spt6 [Lasiodiplodia theobromae]KAF4535419.1 Transcription elongation factor spt6 [Lasiodiplodia theobromae]KAF9638697.1 putative transcription elongation factor spt6 protein [Lasiodiplodia theobromae]KAK0660675.1 Transcription elongation factor spt6 [Lasiodiplodia hormozganensis]